MISLKKIVIKPRKTYKKFVLIEITSNLFKLLKVLWLSFDNLIFLQAIIILKIIYSNIRV